MLSKTRCFAYLSIASACAMPVFAAGESTSENDHTFTASTTFATDYKFRGISQTMSDPAVHGAFEYGHSSGFFAGIWGSNMDSADAGPNDDESDLEIDLYAGWGTSIDDDWSVDGTLIHYLFPHTARGFDLDWTEFQVKAHYREYLTFELAYSNKVFNIDEQGLYYGVSGNYPLSDKYRLTASVGYSDLDDALGDSYMDYSIGAEADLGMFTTRLEYVGADSDGEALFGDNKADKRFVFSITAEFSQ